MEIHTLAKSATMKPAIQQVQHYQKIEKIYQSIIDEAINLMKIFERSEHRTYCLMNHSKNELNSHMIKELLCYFWNITLQVGPHNKTSQIVIDIGKEGIEWLGSNLTTNLLQKTFSICQAKRLSLAKLNPIIINFEPIEITEYYYNVIARGETDYISIDTVEQEIL